MDELARGRLLLLLPVYCVVNCFRLWSFCVERWRCWLHWKVDLWVQKGTWKMIFVILPAPLFGTYGPRRRPLYVPGAPDRQGSQLSA
ncbi:hypothetical protein QBC46DRAFT_112398 [Diplogelasinospora grovesii]|uniref:Uncharacterized protein n=1 Tax=Diplogelasinospora grovesii TaxID=303347 RepID=A0AAN6N827_9PEZI|nr:hypothetical protein QBC46DRAFT_112398 [Diplogelasinospora grovesii]